MRVVLKQEVRGLGRPGDVKEVADGYAQNFLLPKGLAIEASAGELKRVAQERASAKAKQDRAHGDAEALARRLDAIALVFTLKAGEQGKTFGSVTTKDIEAQLAAQGFAIDRKKIQLAEPIKAVGSYDVPIKLVSDVTATVKVEVVAK